MGWGMGGMLTAGQTFRQFDALIHALALIHLEIWESSPNQGIRAIFLFGADLSGLEVLKYWQLFLSPDHLSSIGRFRAAPTYPIISYHGLSSKHGDRWMCLPY